MKIRNKNSRKQRRSSPLRRIARGPKKLKEPSLLDKIALVTDELQVLRSRLANAGDDLPAVGSHRVASVETELERLWELRRREQATPLREIPLTEEEEKVLAFPGGTRNRQS